MSDDALSSKKIIISDEINMNWMLDPWFGAQTLIYDLQK